MRIKILLSLVAAFVLTYVTFRNINSPQVLVARVGNAIYKNGVTNKILVNNPVYQNMMKNALVGRAEAAEDHVIYYKGKKLIINSRGGEIPPALLESIYQYQVSQESNVDH